MNITIPTCGLYYLITMITCIIGITMFCIYYYHVRNKYLQQKIKEYSKQLLEITIIWFEISILRHVHGEENFHHGFFSMGTYRAYFDKKTLSIVMITKDVDMTCAPIYYQNEKFINRWYSEEVYEDIQKSFYNLAYDISHKILTKSSNSLGEENG